MARTREKGPAWMRSPRLVRFINELSKHGNASHALRSSKATRAWVYKKRHIDAEFAEAFERARKCGLEILADEAHRRAYEGVRKPVIYQGKETPIEVREYSDTLLMFLIKQHDPSYRERFQVDHGNVGGRPFLFQMQLHPDVAGE